MTRNSVRGEFTQIPTFSDFSTVTVTQIRFLQAQNTNGATILKSRYQEVTICIWLFVQITRLSVKRLPPQPQTGI